MGMIALMLANYFHDLAVALLGANMLAVYLVGRYVDAHPIREPIVSHLFARMARVTYFVLGYVILAGAVRAWFFMDFEWNPAVGRGQVAALVVKHVLMVAVTGAGLTFLDRYRRRYGEAG